MSITTTIVKPLENGYVQVDSVKKNGYKRHFKVPNNSARSFSQNLIKQDKSYNIYSNIIFWSSIILGVGGAAFFTKNLNSNWQKFFIQTGSAIGFTSLTSYGVNTYAALKENELLQQHQAKEIYYKA